MLTFFFGQVQDEGRVKVREALTPQAMQMALRRVISFPCKKQYTVVILMPKSSRWNSLISVVSWSSGGFSRDAKVRYCIYHGMQFSQLNFSPKMRSF